MTDYVLGVDVSKWQGDMNWEKCAEAGAKFAFIRAGSITLTTGACYTDYHFLRNASLAPDHLPVGYYWYWRPNHDPVKQADYFCDLIEDEEQSLPPVIDMETSGGLTARLVTESAVAFIAKVYDRLKVWPIVYSRGYWLNRYTISHPIWNECDLWAARYKSTLTEPWSDGYAVPRDWDTWTFWQYIANSNRAVEFGGEGPPGGDDDIDLNWFNGDEEAFQEYLGKPFPPSPVLPPDIGVKVNIEIDGKDVKYQGKVNLVE
jgi:lysozyme